jgi:hypothetical protein
MAHTDFGLARIKNTRQASTSSMTCSNSNRWSTDSRTKSVGGSAGVSHPLKWAAPETLRANEYSKSSDTYMTGVFFWELWHQSVPYPELDSLAAAMQVLHQDLRPAFVNANVDSKAGVKLKALVEACWVQDVNARPTMEDVHARMQIVLHHDHVIDEIVNQSAGHGGGDPSLERDVGGESLKRNAKVEAPNPYSPWDMQH